MSSQSSADVTKNWRLRIAISILFMLNIFHGKWYLAMQKAPHVEEAISLSVTDLTIKMY
jgi:hypothetical protein